MSLIKLTMREVSVDLFCMVQSEQSRKIKLSYELVTFILRRSILIHYDFIYVYRIFIVIFSKKYYPALYGIFLSRVFSIYC